MSCCASSEITGIDPGLWNPPPKTPPVPPPPGAPVTVPGPFQTDEFTPIVIQLDPTNSIGDPVAYSGYAGYGAVQIDGTVMTYTPNTNHFFMGDTITFFARDISTGLVFTASFSISGTPVAGPPVIVYRISEFGSFPGATNGVLFPADGQPALIYVNSIGSFSTELLPVTPSWYDGTNCILNNQPSGGLQVYAGAHTITLSVTDGISTSSESKSFEILSPASASAYLGDFVNQSGLAPKTTRRLSSMLFKASSWLSKGKVRRGYVELSDFQKRIYSGKDSLDPTLGFELDNAAQEIINNLPPLPPR
jgi:hypothetical protein